MRVQPSRYGPTIAAIFSKCAHRPGTGRRLSRKTSRRSRRRLSYPGHHQGISLSHAPDRFLGPGVQGMLQVALVDLRPDSPTFGAKNTLYVGALRPWQILIPPGVAHGYKVIGEQPHCWST